MRIRYLLAFLIVFSWMGFAKKPPPSERLRKLSKNPKTGLERHVDEKCADDYGMMLEVRGEVNTQLDSCPIPDPGYNLAELPPAEDRDNIPKNQGEAR